MSKFYKRLIFLVLFIGTISGAVLYFTIDVGTLSGLRTFQPWSLIAVAAAMTVGMYFDGTRLLHLVAIAGERITLREAVQVIFSNYFLAMLTPGAAGGAVAQVVFLRRAGIPTGKATVIVLVRTILSILFLLVCLPGVFLRDPALLPWIPIQVLVGGALLILVGCVGGILIFRTPVPAKLTLWMTEGRSRRKFRRRLIALLREIRAAVELLSSSPASMLRVFLESGISLLSLYSVVPILIAGLGALVPWTLVMGRMIFLNILLYFAPTPGGSGIAEGGFVLLFGAFAPQGTAGVLAVAWRLIAEYVPFVCGLYFTVKVFGRDFLTKQLK